MTDQTTTPPPSPVEPEPRYLGSEGTFYTPETPWFMALPIPIASDQAEANTAAVAQLVDVVSSLVMDVIRDQFPDVDPDVLGGAVSVGGALFAYRALTLAAATLEQMPVPLTGTDASDFMRWLGVETLIDGYGEALVPRLSDAFTTLSSLLFAESQAGDTND